MQVVRKLNCAMPFSLFGEFTERIILRLISVQYFGDKTQIDGNKCGQTSDWKQQLFKAFPLPLRPFTFVFYRRTGSTSGL